MQGPGETEINKMKPSPSPTISLLSPSHWCRDSFRLGWGVGWGDKPFPLSQRGNSVASFLEELAAKYPGCCAQGCRTLRWRLANGLQPVANWKAVTWPCSLPVPILASTRDIVFPSGNSCRTGEGLLPPTFPPCISCHYIPGMHSEDGPSSLHVFHSVGWWRRSSNKTGKLFSPLGSTGKLAIVS